MSNPRILVADDDPSIRQLLRTIVEREGFQVDCTGDGRQAIEKLKQSDYAVILLDLMMPIVNGFDVIRYLKENPPMIKPVVLVISAYTDQTFRDVDPNIVAGVLRKPFEVGDLAGIVRLCVTGFEEHVLQTIGDVAWLANRGSTETESLPN